MKWYCQGCTAVRAASDRVACPACCGWTSATRVAAKLRAIRNARVMRQAVAA